MSSPNKKVVLQADDNFIKHLYAEHEKEYKICSSCSFTTTAGSSSPTAKNGGHQRKKINEIINRRVTKFYHFFDPMMNFLLMNRYAMYNKQHKIGVEIMPTDHIMVVHLIDLPPSSSDTTSSSAVVRSQLRIDKLEPRAVANLNEAERKSLRDDLSSKEPEEYLLPHLISYTTPDEGYTWTSIRTNSYDFNPLIIGRVSQKALMGRIIAFAQGINEIAKGERQDLYDMIKKQMKEARKQQKAVVATTVPLRSLHQERKSIDADAAAPCQLNGNDKENTTPNDHEDKISSTEDGTGIGMKKMTTTTTSKGRIDEDEKYCARKNML
jgi:hypothetical protein